MVCLVCAERRRQAETPAFRHDAILRSLVELHGIWCLTEVAERQQAAHMYQSGQGAHSERTAAESEQKHLVTRLVFLDEVGVQLEQVLRHAIPEAERCDMSRPIANDALATLSRFGADTLVVL